MPTQIISSSESLVLTRFEHIIATKFGYLKTGRLFLAISGGKDSMALSDLLLKAGIKHTLLHCNFKLRGQESDDDETFLRSYAATHGLNIEVRHFDTYKIAEEEKLSIQECARKLRYGWFKTFLDKEENSYLLTAHHLDDSIETFFINLFRGTGFRGLAGIPVAENKIIRPLSEFTSDEILDYVEEHQIEFRRDSSNAKRDYLRNSIRLDLMPVLTGIEPDLHPKMKQVFDELTQLKKQVDSSVEAFRNKHGEELADRHIYPLNEVRDLNDFMREQVFRSFGIYRKNSSEFSKFLSASTGAQFFTGDYYFLIDREQLMITQRVKGDNSVTMVHALPLSTYCAGKNISLELKTEFEINKSDRFIQQFDTSTIQLPLTIRTWKEGDRIQPLGMTGTRLISDILTDKKTDRITKENCLVVLNGDNQLICLIGHTINDQFKISGTTKSILEIRSAADAT